MDVRIWSAIISASVAIFIAVINHFIITPIKEKRQRKREQLLNLYAPAYALICLRIKIVKKFSLANKKLMLGDDEKRRYQSREYMESFIHERSGFATAELLNAWVDYGSQFGKYDVKLTEKLVMVIVRDYNRLKKELNLSYSKEELETGIPDCIKEYRKIIAER